MIVNLPKLTTRGKGKISGFKKVLDYGTRHASFKSAFKLMRIKTSVIKEFYKQNALQYEKNYDWMNKKYSEDLKTPREKKLKICPA